MPLGSMLGAIPAMTISDGPGFSYLRQTSRDNNAAPVTPGAEKPVSQYGLIDVHDELSVATGFSRNTVVARCETRAALAVKRPAGIARLTLTAA
ncbi:hypothetical protein ASH02_07385 [Nocardioides sp. Soil796]|nr:hypothetical protein ASH02_07385 [Nocardioides sp. Soil796]